MEERFVGAVITWPSPSSQTTPLLCYQKSVRHFQAWLSRPPFFTSERQHHQAAKIVFPLSLTHSRYPQTWVVHPTLRYFCLCSIELSVMTCYQPVFCKESWKDVGESLFRWSSQHFTTPGWACCLHHRGSIDLGIASRSVPVVGMSVSFLSPPFRHNDPVANVSTDWNSGISQSDAMRSSHVRSI